MAARRPRRILHPKVLTAQKVNKRIRETDFGAFQDLDCEGEWLHFPGFAWTPIGSRPPREFLFCPREAYLRVFREVLQDDERTHSDGVIIVGPKGSGKSCILRAIAVELIGRLGRDFKVVCFWYFNARCNMAEQVRDALLFSFCEEHMSEIEAIEKVADFRDFLQARTDAGDKIVLVSDGEERYDIEHNERRTRRTPDETRRRADAKEWLQTFEGFACRVIKTLSDARAVPERMKLFRLGGTLQQAERDGFLALSCPLLMRMLERHPRRRPDVRMHGGQHPMSLSLLNKACEDYAKQFASKVSRKRKALPLRILDAETNEEIEEPEQEEVEEEELECYLDDDEDWQEVLAMFRRAEPFKAIRDYIVEDHRGEVERLRALALLLKAYIDKDGAFCTDFLYKVHLQACLERLKTSVFRAPTFVSYLGRKLANPSITWAEIGWALEGFLADAIMALGLKVLDGNRKPSQCEVLEDGPEQIKREQLEVNVPIYLVPGCYFKYVDGLLAWVDENEVVHIVALQETVSPETHRRTEYKFMQREEAARWFSGANNVRFYYVYLCPSPTEAGTKEPEKQPQKQPQKQPPADMVPYVRLELKLSECFGANLGQQELLLLSKLGELRDKEVMRRKEAKGRAQQKYDNLLKSLPAEKQALFKEAKRNAKSRKWLEAEAMRRGIQNPGKKVYKNMYVLLEAM